MKTDVVVIGGGVAGLAAGALVAKGGRSVVVLEKGNSPGGRAYCYEDKGFTLNYGPHGTYRFRSGVLAEVLARLGKPPIEHGIPDPMKSYWSDGDRFAPLGAKPHQAITTGLFPLTSRLKLGPLMLAIRTAKPEKLGDVTWRQWVEGHTGDAALRRFAIALGTVNSYTRPAADLSARWLLSHFQRSLFEKDYVGYMSGGWRTMFDAFIDALRSAGGELRTGAQVDRLETEAGRIVAAITPAERFEADTFVCTLAPQDAPSIAGADAALAAELSRWSGLQDVRAACIDLGFSHKVRTDLTFVFDVERDLYFSLHSEVTPDLAPQGGQLLHAMAYLSAEEAADEALAEARRQDVVAGLDRFFPGWREAAVVQRTLPDVRVVTARRTPEQEAKLVPLRSSVTPNLYFAGDGRNLNFVLSQISMASAMEVADAIAQAPPVRAEATVA